jgi:O-antigen/teichoic acid export membrane protein
VHADPEVASVTRQGIWVLVGLIGVSVLGFGFWALAARLFSHDAVGIAASLVSLSTLGASLAIVGFDTGIMRFASRELHPRKLIRMILLVTGLSAATVGVALPLGVLTINHVDSGLLGPLVGLGLALTVWTVWSFVTNGVFLAGRKAQVSSSLLLVYGVLKIVLLVALVSAGVVGLFAAYTLPLLLLVVASFLLIPRYWPAENPKGRHHSLWEIATLSAGNWISSSGISLPNLSGPALVLTIFGAASAAYFFLAFQLAEVLNYGADAIAKSLLTHGSRENYLSRSLISRVRTRVYVVLVPLVAAGIFAAPTVGRLVGGPGLAAHALSIQLFLLATLPRSFYQILMAQFNVDRRPMAVGLCGATYGILTFGGFVAGLLLRLSEDVLPVAWILGGIGAVIVGLYLARRAPPLPRAAPAT